MSEKLELVNVLLNSQEEELETGQTRVTLVLEIKKKAGQGPGMLWNSHGSRHQDMALGILYQGLSKSGLHSMVCSIPLLLFLSRSRHSF